MKGIIQLFVCGLALLLILAPVAADAKETKHGKNMWICTTNASGASNDMDKKVDDEMSEKAKMASAAFAFAMKHCRDCTEITCKKSS